ncbi:MAG: glycerophosphodiester phosphodiesterase [Chitinophagaceae bacterium]|nr:glycerophosphodiester phosphodiesterase [Chitinophagaceae bacterium]
MEKLQVILCTCLIFACSSSKKNAAVNNQSQKSAPLEPGVFDKQGHRGCRGLMPENTVPGMLFAIGSGVTTLEMDVVITKDKQVILSHEPFFNHEITTKPDGSFVTEKEEKTLNIYNMTFAETQKYDVGLKPHPRFLQQQKMAATKPLLADVFEAVKTDMMTRRRPFPYYNIETKTTPATDNIYHPAPSEFVELLMKVIKEKDMEEYVIIQSFDFRTLQYLHQHYPKIKTALLIEANNLNSFRKQLTDLGFTPDIYSPEAALVTDILINNCHEKKIKIIPWTVNDKKEIERLKALGVDGIISDYPNLFNE